MMLSYLMLLSLFLCSIAIPKGTSLPLHLGEALSHYDSIHKDQLKHKTFRAGISFNERLVELPLASKIYQLHLAPHRRAFSEHLQAHTVDGRGRREPLDFNKNHFFKGTVFGHEGSWVVAHLPEDGILTASISLNTSHTFYVERSHLHIQESHDYHMIAYLGSDVKWNITGFQLDSVTPDPLPVEFDLDDRDHRRLKRLDTTTPADRVCPMALVADHRFTASYAMGSASLAASLMVVQMLESSVSYQKTTFEGTSTSFFNYGLQVHRVTVHTGPTDSCATNPLHYNCAATPSSDDLLTYFALSDWSAVCLAHLFTHIQFSDGRLGLAYIGEAGTAGGICQTTRRRDATTGELITYNTGFTSYVSPQGRRLLQREGLLATTHEIGHGWGGQHDPADLASSCNAGGPYIMYPFAQDGSEPAHREFSKCSKLLIGRTLESKGGCFEVGMGDFCGNGVADEGEECDPGLVGNSSCCDRTCRLKPPAVCSDANHVCCQNCQRAPASLVCRPGSSLLCHSEVYCDGSAVTCPAVQGSPSSPVGSPCFAGTCQMDEPMGPIECVEHCSRDGREPCLCTEDDACMVCCRATDTSPCLLLNDSSTNQNVRQSEGSQCLVSGVMGICENSTCQLVNDFQRSVGRSAAPVRHPLEAFIASNIVGTVAFFMFVLFLVPSCALHWLYDRKYYDKYLKQYLVNTKKSKMGEKKKMRRENTFRRGPSPRQYMRRNRNDVSVTFEGEELETPFIEESPVTAI